MSRHPPKAVRRSLASHPISVRQISRNQEHFDPSLEAGEHLSLTVTRWANCEGLAHHVSAHRRPAASPIPPMRAAGMTRSTDGAGPIDEWAATAFAEFADPCLTPAAVRHPGLATAPVRGRTRSRVRDLRAGHDKHACGAAPERPPNRHRGRPRRRRGSISSERATSTRTRRRQSSAGGLPRLVDPPLASVARRRVTPTAGPTSRDGVASNDPSAVVPTEVRRSSRSAGPAGAHAVGRRSRGPSAINPRSGSIEPASPWQKPDTESNARPPLTDETSDRSEVSITGAS